MSVVQPVHSKMKNKYRGNFQPGDIILYGKNKGYGAPCVVLLILKIKNERTKYAEYEYYTFCSTLPHALYPVGKIYTFYQHAIDIYFSKLP